MVSAKDCRSVGSVWRVKADWGGGGGPAGAAIDILGAVAAASG